MQIINFHKTALFWKLVFLKLGIAYCYQNYWHNCTDFFVVLSLPPLPHTVFFLLFQVLSTATWRRYYLTWYPSFSWLDHRIALPLAIRECRISGISPIGNNLKYIRILVKMFNKVHKKGPTINLPSIVKQTMITFIKYGKCTVLQAITMGIKTCKQLSKQWTTQYQPFPSLNQYTHSPYCHP